MRATYKTTAATMFVLSSMLLMFSPMQAACSSHLNISLSTSKQVYSAGDRIAIYGNLTLDGNPVPDGVATIEVDDARGYPRIVRALPTGSDITKQWPVEIVSVIPIDSMGPRYTFGRGSDIGFAVTIKNNDLVAREVNLTICIYYPNEVVLRTTSLWSGTLSPNETSIISSWPIATISTTAPLGTGYVYASVLKPPLPKDGGFAYAPERCVAFSIVSTAYSSSSEASLSMQEPATSTDGAFSLAFRTPTTNARLGNYTVYAVSFYPMGPYPYYATNITIFEVVLVGDLNMDGRCDIKDIAIVAKAFGSFPGYPNWNPIADVCPDSKIDIRDIATVAKDYGKTGLYP